MVSETFQRIFGVARYLAARDGEVLVSALAKTLNLTTDYVEHLCETEGATMVALRFVGESLTVFVREN